MKKLFLITAMAAIAASCNKPTTEPVVDTATITFTNKLDKPVTIRLADSGADRAFYLHVAAHGMVRVPNEKFQTGYDGFYKGLMYYWATDDYSMSNWYMVGTSDHWLNQPALPYNKSITYNIDINPVPARKDMQYALRGIDGDTKWVAVDARDAAGKSIWNTLSTGMRDKQARLTYLCWAVLNDSSSQLAFIYTPQGDASTFDIKSVYDNLPYRMSNKVGSAGLHSTSADTAFLWLDGKPPYYVMVKQP